MPRFVRSVLAVCLLSAPAAPAACLNKLDIPLAGAAQPSVPNLRPLLDWSVIIVTQPAPLTFLEDQKSSASEALAVTPVVRFSDPERSAAAAEVMAFVIVLVGLLVAGTGAIPRVHRVRLRLKSLNLRLPLH